MPELSVLEPAGLNRAAVQRAYFSFQLLALTFLPILLATICIPSKRIHPQPVLISLCVTWILSPILFSLLLFTGHLNGADPPSGLCIAQASLVMGQSVMTTASALAFVFHIWSVISSARPVIPHYRLRTTILVVMPYVLFAGFVIATALVGSHHPDKVKRKTFYCSIDVDAVLLSTSVTTEVFLISTIIFTIIIGVLLRRNYTRIVREDRGTAQLMIRVVVFGFYLLLALGLSIVAFIDFSSPVPDLFHSTIGFAVFVVFGSQREILRTWASWLGISVDRSTGSGRPSVAKSGSGSGGNGPNDSFKLVRLPPQRPEVSAVVFAHPNPSTSVTDKEREDELEAIYRVTPWEREDKIERDLEEPTRTEVRVSADDRRPHGRMPNYDHRPGRTRFT